MIRWASESSTSDYGKNGAFVDSTENKSLNIKDQITAKGAERWCPTSIIIVDARHDRYPHAHGWSSIAVDAVDAVPHIYHPTQLSPLTDRVDAVVSYPHLHTQ